MLRQKLNFDADTKNIALSINALKYCGSGEVFGICPLPSDEMRKLGILPSETTDSDLLEENRTVPQLQDTVFMRIGSTLRIPFGRYKFFANNQCTKYAVVAVHTMKEKFEFRSIHQAHYQNRRIDFVEFANKFNARANGVDIFYKTTDHLEKYLNRFEVLEGVSRTEEIYQTALTFIEQQVVSINSPSHLLAAASPEILSVTNTLAIVPKASIDAQLPPLATLEFPSLQQSLQQAQQQQQQLAQLQQQYHYRQIAELQHQYYYLQTLSSSTSKPRTVLPVSLNWNVLTHQSQAGYSHPYHRAPVTTKRVTPRSCKGCGSEVCSGKNKRSDCNRPRCLKCSAESDCSGIWNAKNCTN